MTEAQRLIERALEAKHVGPLVLQAAIAAVHANAPTFGETDWAQIVGFYDALCRAEPSPVVALNRAVAIGMRDGPEIGLFNIEAVFAQGSLDDYHLAHAARAEMQFRLGRAEAARASYERAWILARQPVERRFIERRLGHLGDPSRT